MKNSPRGWEKITYQTAGNNDESLEPHACVHAHGHKEDDKNVSAAPPEPKELWREAIAEKHAEPPVPPVWSENAVPKCEPLVRIAAVPRHEKFHGVRVAHERAGQQNDLCHFVDVRRRNDVIQFEDRTRGNQQCQHHGKTAEDCSGHKIRRKNGCVPRRQHRRSEIKRYNAVDRQNQRSRKSGQQKIRHFVVTPVAVCAAPAESEKSENKLPDLCSRPITQRRQIPRHPETTDMDARENRGANHREKGHRFSGTIDRSTPFLPQQKQDRGDECAGVSDTNPENEICNVPGPANWDMISPRADAGGNQVTNTKKSECRHAGGDRESHPPPAWRTIFYDARDSLREPAEIAPVQNKRSALDLPFGILNSFLWWCCSVHGQIAKFISPASLNWGCGSSRDNWSARRCSSNRANDNCAPVLSFLKRDFPDP